MKMGRKLIAALVTIRFGSHFGFISSHSIGPEVVFLSCRIVNLELTTSRYRVTCTWRGRNLQYLVREILSYWIGNTTVGLQHKSIISIFGFSVIHG